MRVARLAHASSARRLMRHDEISNNPAVSRSGERRPGKIATGIPWEASRMIPVAISPDRLWRNGSETEALARPTPLGCAPDSSAPPPASVLVLASSEGADAVVGLGQAPPIGPLGRSAPSALV